MSKRFFFAAAGFPLPRLRALLAVAGVLLPFLASAAPIAFDLPAGPATETLLVFSRQAKIEVLFSFDELHTIQTGAIHEDLEPEDALNRLLRGTGLAARRKERGKFVVTRATAPTGTVRGRLLLPDGSPARDVRVLLSDLRRATTTDRHGRFEFAAVPAGIHRFVVSAPGFHPLEYNNLVVGAGQAVAVPPQQLHAAEDVTQLEPYVVEGSSDPWHEGQGAFPVPRQAASNLDLPRTSNDVLPYTIYTRDLIARSGVVNLNDFLQRNVLDSDGAPPAEDGRVFNLFAGSTNLNLRGYPLDETVVLVNGRRLPEVLSAGYSPLHSAPDVNFIPLSLVEQVEVLPVSASALYSGNAVGGVINIVLRQQAANATELNTTYTNAVGGFDAPQASVSLLHGQTLLDGALRLRLNASATRSIPPSETELGLHQARPPPEVPLADPVYRATPNLRSAAGTPLFGPGTSPVTSVAPGADGTGGLAAFAGREGLRNFGLFDSPGGLASSTESIDYPYGREQRRATFYLSGTYDILPWLQLGLDTTYSMTRVNRGFDVFAADLDLAAASPFNPFGQDVKVSLNETAPALGQNHSEARTDFFSTVLGVLVRLPANWQVMLDAQYAHNTARYRGLAPVDVERWQELVDQGVYNPLRDTQRHGPPPEFYERALVYYGAPGRFVTLGDYQVADAAVRLTNQSLSLPTGRSTLNIGGDYRINHLDGYLEELRHGDGSYASDPVPWSARTLQRYSAFGELQAPLLPEKWLPRALRRVETDLAVRYIAADTANETNVAPTFGLKVDFAAGLSVRGSLTTSNRFPTPSLSRQGSLPSPGSGSGFNTQTIADPLRHESYPVIVTDLLNPNLSTESAVTQSAGLIWQTGHVHRFRAAVDFLDTRKTDELIGFEAQQLVNLEALFPERVVRGTPAPGDPAGPARIETVYPGAVNTARRHSQNWNISADYAWAECLGGTLDVYGRLVWFQRYDTQLLPTSPTVDQLSEPDGAVPGLLRYRSNFGASWSGRAWGFGVDGHYYHSRILPLLEQPGQGSDHIKPYWQFDAYVQGDVARWLPRRLREKNGQPRFGLQAQLRVNNISGFDFPKYVYDPSGAGVQPYGDWRGRTYSLSLTATF